MNKTMRFTEKLFERHVHVARRLLEAGHDALAQIARSCERLADDRSPLRFVEHHDVGKSAADIDRERVHGATSQFQCNY